MFRTIRARVVALVVVLVCGAAASIAVWSTRVSVRAVRAVARSDAVAALGPLRATLAEAHARLEWREAPVRVAEWARASGRAVLLTDPSGRRIAAAPDALRDGDYTIDATGHLTQWRVDDIAPPDSAGRMVRLRRVAVPEGGAPSVEVVDTAGRRIATLYDVTRPEAPQGIVAPVDIVPYRPFAIVAGGIALVAVLLTLFLSRRVLGPVEELTAAARRMSGGDFAQRVTVGGRDEIGELAGAFNAMADSVTRNERLRRTMASDVAHELRTPLTNIRCAVESVVDGVVEPSPAVFMSLQEEVRLLERLVEDLQELALADVGALRLRREPLDPAGEVLHCVRAAERAAMAAGVRLEVALPAAPAGLVADRERVRQMLGNLISNAIMHTPPGGAVTVSITETEQGSIVFSVRDTGCGIAPEHQADVFQRFFRVDPSRTRDTGGAGLGLAIVKSLAEAHGGRVELTSHPGEGSLFRITLPAAQPA